MASPRSSGPELFGPEAATTKEKTTGHTTNITDAAYKIAHNISVS
jgi:hypothetical protein